MASEIVAEPTDYGPEEADLAWAKSNLLSLGIILPAKIFPAHELSSHICTQMAAVSVVIGVCWPYKS